MAKMLLFNKLDEDEYCVYYDMKSDNFIGNLEVNKIYKEVKLLFKSTSRILNDLEITEIKTDYVEWVINKRTENLTVFPDTFDYNS